MSWAPIISSRSLADCPWDRAFWSAALVPRIAQSIKQVRETTTRLRGLHFVTCRPIVTAPLSDDGVDFPRLPRNQRRIVWHTRSWNGLCHPAVVLLGSSPVPVPSPWDFFISGVRVTGTLWYLGVCSRATLHPFVAYRVWPQDMLGAVSVPNAPLSCQTSRFHWRHSSR